MSKNAESVLSAVPLFADLSKSELKHVLKEVREEVYSSGQDMVTEGQSGGPFFVITEGRADIIIGGEKVGELLAGDHFGEMALLDDQPRSATVRANGRVKALAMSSWNFLGTLAENWDITKKVLAQLSQRVRELEQT